MAGTTTILPELQNFEVGNKVPISLVAEEVFYAIEPNQYLTWAGQSGSNPDGFAWSAASAGAAIRPASPVRLDWIFSSISPITWRSVRSCKGSKAG